MEYVDLDNPPELIEFIAPIISFPLIALYHILLALEVIISPYRTTLGSNYHERRFWAIKVLGKEGNELMGIQSIRNAIIASTLLASTSIAIIFGILQTIIPMVNFSFSIQTLICFLFILLVNFLIFALFYIYYINKRNN